MNRTNAILISAALLAVPLVAVLVAGTASAHVCNGQDPGRDCGDCRKGLYHDHDYNGGRDYCDSIGPGADVQLITFHTLA